MIIDLSVGNRVPPFSFKEISIEFLKQINGYCSARSQEKKIIISPFRIGAKTRAILRIELDSYSSGKSFQSEYLHEFE